MNAIWISLKGNTNCGCKITDVARLPGKIVRRKSSIDLEETKLECKLTDKQEDSLIHPKFRHYYIRNRFHELEIGDPSRKVVEMIFRASSTNPTKCSRKIKRVLKVNNTLDILAKFEKYRETVMVSSNEQHKRPHPRSIVDGNELLQFYGTTMSCCSRNTLQVSQLCRDPSCRVCRIIQAGFNTSYNKIFGVRLSMNSEQMSEDITAIVKAKNAKKAVIVCRTIAGRIVGMEGAECEQEYEAVGDGLSTKPKSMIVRNPSAVLPCFVIVFD